MSHFRTEQSLRKETYYTYEETIRKESMLAVSTDHHCLPLSAEL